MSTGWYLQLPPPPPVLYRDELISFQYWKWAGADSLKKITLYLETLRWHNCCWMVEQTWNLATTKATTLSTLLLVLAIYLFFDSCSKYYGATLTSRVCLSSCTEGSLDGEHGTIEQHRAPLCRRECRGKFLCLRLELGASLIGRSQVEVMTELIVNGMSLSSTNSRCPLWSYTILVSHCFWHGSCNSSFNSIRCLIHPSNPSITLLLQHIWSFWS